MKLKQRVLEVAEGRHRSIGESEDAGNAICRAGREREELCEGYGADEPVPWRSPSPAVMFQGNGANIVYIDWENDLLVVVRWIRGAALNEFLGKVIGALAAGK
jgi:hypothetical protein